MWRTGKSVFCKKLNIMFADLVGYLTLLVIVGVLASVALSDGTGYIIAGFAWLVLTLMGHHFWHSECAPVVPWQWLFVIGAVLLVGGIVFLFDGIWGQVLNPRMGFVEGALHTGMFGGASTVAVTAALSAISVAGFVRSFFISTPRDGDFGGRSAA